MKQPTNLPPQCKANTTSNIVTCGEDASKRGKSAGNKELGRRMDGRVVQHECKHNDVNRDNTKGKGDSASGDSGYSTVL